MGTQGRVIVVAVTDLPLLHRVMYLATLRGKWPVQATRSPADLAAILRRYPGSLVISTSAERAWVGPTFSRIGTGPTGAHLEVLPTDDPADGREAIRAGATSTISLSRLERDLPLAVDLAMRGFVVVPSAVLADVRERKRVNPGGEQSRALPVLTAREEDVLQLAAAGHTNRQIAELLGISVKTVETYKHRLRTRFRLSNRRDLVELAAQRASAVEA